MRMSDEGGAIVEPRVEMLRFPCWRRDGSPAPASALYISMSLFTYYQASSGMSTVGDLSFANHGGPDRRRDAGSVCGSTHDAGTAAVMRTLPASHMVIQVY
jgi:hypothetical protein